MKMKILDTFALDPSIRSDFLYQTFQTKCPCIKCTNTDISWIIEVILPMCLCNRALEVSQKFMFGEGFPPTLDIFGELMRRCST